MTNEFCRFLTEDGLELQGLFVPPGDGARTALVHVHGLDGNFYENRFIDTVAEVCRRRGLGFLTFNNRGHDYISDIIVEREGEETGFRQVGGMYERLEECVPDIRAAIEFVWERGCERVLLQGHSHGGIKVLHYLSETRDPAVVGLVLMSPSDDFGLARANLGKRFEEFVEMARRMKEQGRERMLMPVAAFPYPTSGLAFLDTLGPDSIAKMFNLSRTDREEFPELNSVEVPVLMVVGTVEEAFVQPAQEYVDRVGEQLARVPSFTGVVVEGAPHNYLGCEDEVAGALDRWLADNPGLA